MTRFQGVTRYAQQLQRVFSLKGGDAVSFLSPSVQPVHPITDVNAGELQLLKGHLLSAGGYKSTVSASPGIQFIVFNPANSGKVTVITRVTLFVDGTSTAADTFALFINPVVTGPPGGALLNALSVCDSRGIAPAGSFAVTAVNFIVGTLSTPAAGVLAEKSRIIGAAAQVQETLDFTQPLTLFPNSAFSCFILKAASNWLAVSLASMNLVGYERSFEPAEVVAQVGTAL